MSVLPAPLDTDTAPVAGKLIPAEKHRRGAGGKVAVLILIVVAFTMISPFLWAGMAATKETQIAFANPPQFLYSPNLQAFIDLWQTTDFFRYVINTTVIALGSVLVSLLVAAPAAYALSRYDRRISALLLVLALIFRSLPRFAVALPFYDFAKALGIYDTKLALVVAFVALNQPFTLWLLRNFFAEIPRELDEAAMVDGCTRFTAFQRVILPLMGPGLVTAGIFTFLLAFQEYLVALVLSDVDSKTIPVFLAGQIGQTLPLLQQASAATTLLALPVFLVAFVAQRFLVAGLTGGAVKG